jgi:hypothetical protein
MGFFRFVIASIGRDLEICLPVSQKAWPRIAQFSVSTYDEGKKTSP